MIVGQTYGSAFRGTVWPDLMKELDCEVQAFSSLEDAAYWYGEAQLTAMLGAQARRVSDAEGWFLVEPSSRGRGRGRRVRFVDLWMGFGRAQDEQCTVEAKFLSASPRGKWLPAARRRLDSARKQLSSLRAGNLVGAPISLLWVCVYSTKKDKADAVRTAFNQAITKFADDPDVFVVAFQFDDAPRFDARYHPGFLGIGRLEEELWRKRSHA